MQIFNSSNPDTTLWVIWANKETAYKIIRKCDLYASFIPRFFNVNLNCENNINEASGGLFGKNIFSGEVKSPHGEIRTRTLAEIDYVHCIGINSQSEEIGKINWKVERINPSLSELPDYESTLVREALRKYLSRYLSICKQNIEIRRRKLESGLGPPIVHIKDRSEHVDITLSHDGCFIAYGFIVLTGVLKNN